MPIPDQVYIWSVFGIPFQHFLAAPVPNATNYIAHAAADIIAQANRLVPTNGGAITTNNPISLVWTGLVAFSPPMLTAVKDSGRDFVAGGLTTFAPAGKRGPAELYERIIGRTNLVY